MDDLAKEHLLSWPTVSTKIDQTVDVGTRAQGPYWVA